MTITSRIPARTNLSVLVADRLSVLGGAAAGGDVAAAAGVLPGQSRLPPASAPRASQALEVNRKARVALTGAIALVILSLPRDGLPAQEAAAVGTPCDDRVVSSIVITPLDPARPRFPSALRWLLRAVGVAHTTTTAAVVERFLFLDVGQPCTERRRAESERVLRLQPFLADATVRAVPDTLGGTRIEVETIDEIPTVLLMRFSGRRPTALRLGSGNVAGQGLYLAATVERGFAYRTGLGINAVAHQVFGRPYTLAVSAERAPLGGALTLALGYPFLTDLQPAAWHLGYDDELRYVTFSRRDGEALSLEIDRRFWDVGGVQRIGGGSRSAFGGVLITHEDMEPARAPVVIADSGLAADTTGELGDPFDAYSNLRLSAVFGARVLSFRRVRGFDALLATQDVATGVQLGTLVARGIPRLGSHDDDLFVAGDLYAGLGHAASFGTLRAAGEARRDGRTRRWDSMVASGRVAWYVKPVAAHVLIGSVEIAGGWRGRVPFQLRLGDHQGGVRGHSASRAGGAVRGVARIEERWVLGRVTEHAAVGLAGFVDAGRVWAGDTPFGVDSRTEVGIGGGLLAAFPPQSQRLWRLDVAFPVGPDPDARWEVRLTGVWTRPFWREPDDVVRMRAGASPSRIFRW